jgi:hypothetical protein
MAMHRLTRAETRRIAAKVAPAAAEMLPANQPRTVKDLLDLPTWPYGRLRIVIERRPLIEVMIEPV